MFRTKTPQPRFTKLNVSHIFCWTQRVDNSSGLYQHLRGDRRAFLNDKFLLSFAIVSGDIPQDGEQSRSNFEHGDQR